MYEAPRTEEVVLIETKIDWTEERIFEEIEVAGKRYNVSTSTLHAVIKCESRYDRFALGDHGWSRGLVQIHGKYHDVSDEEAYDPEFAIDFLAKHVSEGKGSLWTCYRKLAL